MPIAETCILTHGASAGLYSGLVGDNESSQQEKVRRGNEWSKKEFCDILWTIRLAIRRHASSNSITKLHFILSHNIFKRHLLQRYLSFLVLILRDRWIHYDIRIRNKNPISKDSWQLSWFVRDVTVTANTHNSYSSHTTSVWAVICTLRLILVSFNHIDKHENVLTISTIIK